MNNISYKFRVYPNKTQKLLLAKTFGSCRFVYNYYLSVKINRYKQTKETFSYYDCANDLKNLKIKYTWLKEVDSTAIQSSIKDLDSAYQNFFQGRGFPKFKSKKTHKYSYRSKQVNNNIQFNNRKIKIPKVGWLKTKQRLTPIGRILNATVSQEPNGHYYISLCCEVELPKFSKTNKSIGLDLGIKHFCITSNGDKFENLKYFDKSIKKLKKLQRQLSRKTNGSSNSNKARIKVANLQLHIANQRRNFTQKLSSKLILENDIICIEDLQVKNMIKNHKLARSIADVNWSEFVRELEYKAKWYGKTIIKINKFYPSSQLCNCCGYQYSLTKNLSVRCWICPNCGCKHDRDINAAKNILNQGLKILTL